MDKELGEIRERRIVSVGAGGGRTARPGLDVSRALTHWGILGVGGEVRPLPHPGGGCGCLARSF